MGMKYNIQLSIKTTRTSTGTPMETEFIDLDIIGDDVVNNKIMNLDITGADVVNNKN